MKASFYDGFIIPKMESERCLSDPIGVWAIIFEMDGLRGLGLHKRLRSLGPHAQSRVLNPEVFTLIYADGRAFRVFLERSQTLEFNDDLVIASIAQEFTGCIAELQGAAIA